MKTRVLLAVSAMLLGNCFQTAEAQEKKTSELGVREVLEKITHTPEVLKKSGVEPTPDFAPVVFQQKIDETMKREVVEPEVVTLEQDGETVAFGLTYKCHPRYINTFTVGGQPLKARQFSFSVNSISWRAGDGWPVYHTYCPVNGYLTGNYFPSAKTHQVVPIIMDQNYFVGCASSAVCRSNAPGQIAFAVNDRGVPNNPDYIDNRGCISVTIWGIVP